MKVTEQAIREAMKLADGVAVTLGTLDEPTRTRIAIVARSVYTVRQNGYAVEMLLQFAAFDKGVLGYPSVVTFHLGDPEKLRKFNEAVSGFVTELQAEGDHTGAAAIAALITLPPEQQEKVYDALNAGESKTDFLTRLSAGLNLPAKERA